MKHSLSNNLKGLKKTLLLMISPLILSASVVYGQTCTVTPNVVNLPDIVAECSVDLDTLTVPTADMNCDGNSQELDGILKKYPKIYESITGDTTIIWMYISLSGDTVSQAQNIIFTADIIDPIPDEPTLDDIVSSCFIKVNSLTPPTATDNCDGEIAGIPDLTGEITADATITWTYTDKKGNEITQTQDVIIDINTTPPTPSVATLPAIVDCRVEAIVPPTAKDACLEEVVGTTTASFPITTDQTITWTYTDDYGNVATQTQDIVIKMDNSVTILDEYTVYANAYGNPTGLGDYTYQWYNCANDEPQLTETGRIFITVNNGEYYVKIKNADGTCTATSDCIQMNPLSVTEWKQDVISIYPNPTQGVFTISTDTEMNNVPLEVYSTLGERIYVSVMNGKEAKIDLAKYPNGIYFVKVNHSSTLKVVKR